MQSTRAAALGALVICLAPAGAGAGVDTCYNAATLEACRGDEACTYPGTGMWQGACCGAANEDICFCEHPCVQSSECGEGVSCIGYCYPDTVPCPRCTTDAECWPGEVCDPQLGCIVVLCSTEADCRAGELCYSGTCMAFPCGVDGDCDSGSCADGYCQYARCATSATCEGGDVCYSGFCLDAPSCLGDLDCQGGECVDARCSFDGCRRESDCPATLSCMNGLCLRESANCTREEHCAAGDSCVRRWCTPPLACGTDAECRGAACEAGFCAFTACEADSGCSAGLKCLDGTCLFDGGCELHADCPEGAACRAGSCVIVEPCGADADCGRGQVCRDGVCSDGGCRGDADCAEGQRCEAGACVPASGGEGGGGAGGDPGGGGAGGQAGGGAAGGAGGQDRGSEDPGGEDGGSCGCAPTTASPSELVVAGLGLAVLLERRQRGPRTRLRAVCSAQHFSDRDGPESVIGFGRNE